MKAYQVTFEASARFRGKGYQSLLRMGFHVQEVGFFDAKKLKGSAAETLVRNKSNSNREGFSLPEVCCYLGHLEAWNKFLESGDEIGLIVEDDAMPKVGPEKILEKLATLDTFDAVQLVRRESSYLDHNEHFLRGNPCGYGLIAYVLSRKGAKALIDQGNLKAADLKLMQLSMDGDVFTEREQSFNHDWSIPSTIQGVQV